MNFEEELSALINKYSMENGSDTPDFILAQYLLNCLYNYNKALQARDEHFAFDPWKYDRDRGLTTPDMKPDHPKNLPTKERENTNE